MEKIEGLLRQVDMSLLVLELIVLLLYIVIMSTSTTVSAARSATSWLKEAKRWHSGVDSRSRPVIAAGAVCYCTATILVVATLLVLTGGLILRFLVVYTDDRVLIPGEEKFMEDYRAKTRLF